MCLSVLLVLPGCGKKGPLKLEPELRPKKIKELEITQVGNSMKLQWNFEKRLSGKIKDKSQLEMEPANVTRVVVYYSPKEILGGKFPKKAKVLRKFSPAELVEVTDSDRERKKKLGVKRDPISGKTIDDDNEEDESDDGDSMLSRLGSKKNLSYYVRLPFQLQQLDNKDHFFGIVYYYGKKKSPMSDVAYIHSITPVVPAGELAVNRENKVIKLTWSRPGKDASGKPAPAIAGYHIYKKVRANSNTDTASPDNTTGAITAVDPLEGYRKLNKNKVLTEYYEDLDTGVDGTYFYYVSTIVTNTFETLPSNVVSVEVMDVYPPDIPANLVVFRASDHMHLSWKEVFDSDLSHYRLYRRSPPVREFELIADNLTAPVHKDFKIKRDKFYIYVVTSVDKKGNESDHSLEVRERF